eukprot:scaffold115805_cov42-Phaeocystis_antarctica.AAC.1
MRVSGLLVCSRHCRTPARGGRRSACTATGTSCRCVRSTGPETMGGQDGLRWLGGVRPAHEPGRSQALRADAGTASEGT